LPGERWAMERRGLALEAANTVLLPLARASRFARERLGVDTRYRLESTSDDRVYVVVLELPGSRPLVLGVYATTEESRPITFSRLAPRLRRMKSLLARWAPPGGDTLLFIVPASPKARTTMPARRLLSRLKTGFMAPTELREWLHRYIMRRLHGLLGVLRERSVKAYGPLAGLLRTLYILARELGPVPENLFYEVEAVIRA